MKTFLTAVVLGTVTAGLVYSARSEKKAPAERKVRKGKLTLGKKAIGELKVTVAVDYVLTETGISFNNDSCSSEMSVEAKSLLNNFSDYVKDEMKNPTYRVFTLENVCSTFMATFPNYTAYLN